MQKIRFHDSKIIKNQNFEKKQKHQTQFLDPKKVVDINKLLNRVKIEEKNKKKKTIIFVSSVILSLTCMGILIYYL